MSKRAKPEKLKQFREDLELLRKTYSNAYIALRLNVDEANLSSYGSGAKNPGEKFLNTFYMNFSNETNDQGNKKQPTPYNHESEPITAQEAAIRYLPLQEHNITLKDNNTHLFGYVDTALKMAQNMVEVQKNMVDVQKQMADSSHILIKSNEKMVNYYFQDGGQPQKLKENSPEGNK